ANSMKVLDATIKLAKQNLDKFKPDSKEWETLNANILAGESLLKKYGQATDESAKKERSLRSEIAASREALAQRLATGEATVAEIYAEAKAAGNLKDALGDANQAITALSSDTFVFDAVLSGVNAATAGVQIFAGVSALAGDENEDLQKVLVKLNAVMSITAGIQQAINLLQKNNVLQLGLQVAGNKILAVSNSATAATFRAMGVAVETTSLSFKALRAAIITTGIGALIVGISILIEKIIDWTSSTEDAEEAQNRLKDTIAGVNENISAQQKLLDREKNLAVARAEAEGKSEEDLFSLRKEYSLRNKELLEYSLSKKYNTLQAAREDDKIDEKTYLDALKDYNDTYEQYRDAVAQLEIDRLNEKQRIREKAEEAAKKAADKAKQEADKRRQEEKAQAEADYEFYLKLQNEKDKVRISTRQDGIDAANEAEEEKTKKEQDELDKRFQEQLKALGDRKGLYQQDADNFNRTEEEKTKKAEEESQKRQLIEKTVFTIISNIATIISENQQASNDRQIAEIEKLKDSKIISEEEAQRRITAVRRKAAQQEKQMQLFSAFLSLPQTILSVLQDKTVPSFLKPFVIAANVAVALSNIAAIASRPLPQLYKGTKHAKEGFYRVGELGPELLWHKDTGFKKLGERGEEISFVPEGARVFNAAESASLFTNLSYPQMRDLPEWAVNQIHNGADIDYNKLADAIAHKVGKISDIPGFEVSVDENGFHTMIRRQNDITEFYNKRYSF
ncbi:MAG TPA: hypothetical protein PL045_03320, partial [Chitinophagaceae bacterium]|nr:hypothetical protein [Chitinophagaceae bacterium]